MTGWSTDAHTDLCRTLGNELPIWNAGMGGGLAGPALASAVSNAGGLGVLGIPQPTGLRGRSTGATRSSTSNCVLSLDLVRALHAHRDSVPLHEPLPGPGWRDRA